MTKTFRDLPENHRLQIEMGARGAIGGTLEEWPTLRAALAAMGRDISKETAVKTIKDLCCSLGAYRGCGTFYDQVSESLGVMREEDGRILGARFGFEEKLPQVTAQVEMTDPMFGRQERHRLQKIAEQVDKSI